MRDKFEASDTLQACPEIASREPKNFDGFQTTWFMNLKIYHVTLRIDGFPCGIDNFFK